MEAFNKSRYPHWFRGSPLFGNLFHTFYSWSMAINSVKKIASGNSKGCVSKEFFNLNFLIMIFLLLYPHVYVYQLISGRKTCESTCLLRLPLFNFCLPLYKMTSPVLTVESLSPDTISSLLYSAIYTDYVHSVIPVPLLGCWCCYQHSIGINQFKSEALI